MSLPARGVLAGIRIVELAAVGPVPFAGMLLADMGADIVTVDRLVPSGLGVKKEPRFDPTTRSRPSIAVDLKSDEGRCVVMRLIDGADAMLEGFRPGVLETLIDSPRLLLADEPTGSLDPELAGQIMELFKEQNARGTTILVASHDREMIRSMRKRTIVLEAGRVASDGAYR